MRHLMVVSSNQKKDSKTVNKFKNPFNLNEIDDSIIEKLLTVLSLFSHSI